ncbi:MAG: phenylalanine--tRNA ligase subunit alpha [Patescibacteria group bacterium]
MENIKKDVEKIWKTSISTIETLETLEDIKKFHLTYLGKNSNLSIILRDISKLTVSEKKEVGQFANKVKESITSSLKQREEKLKQTLYDKEDNEIIDTTISGYRLNTGKTLNIGSIHPISAMIKLIEDTFAVYGFSIAEGPEIETDWFCFQALNIPIGHPARDMQDTFYIKENELLPRTHTSSVQIRTMQKYTPPIRIIAPGKVYRNENSDSRHSFMFYQFEGLVIDERSNLKDLANILQGALKRIFNDESIKLRIRNSYFPFTEPSIEIDCSCIFCNMKGCNVCSHKGWLELLGAGMVHPQVLRNVNIDPNKYQGFAFGTGIERLVMIKDRVNDTRLFYENDIRFLSQFRNI